MKRFTAFILSIMLMLELPVLSMAKPAEKIEDSFVFVNPIYEGIVSEDEIIAEKSSEEGEKTLFAGNPEYLTDFDEAAEVLRAQLRERKAQAVVYIRVPQYKQSDVEEIFERALEHTGEPTSGDSLKWVHGGYDADITGYNYGSYSELVFTYYMNYYTTAAQEAELDAEVDRILESLDFEGKNDYIKVKAIYDYICENVTYDYENLNDNSHKLKFTAYAAAINKTSVCQGYALLFYRLALEEGIDARLIAGLGNGGDHGWNIVKLGDYYYNLDSTWDAGQSVYEFFLLNERNFVNHVRFEEYTTSEFHAQYPMSSTDYVYNDDDFGGVDDNFGSENIIASGYCGGEGDGKNLQWTIDKDGVLTISGEGEMADYWEATPQWMEYADSMKSLVIEEGVTTVGNSAFRYCSGFTGNLVIPDSVETIGEFAFADCTGFDGDLVIGNNVTDIGREAFARCTGFKGTLTLGLRVESIGNNAFTGCNGFTGDIAIPNSVKTIGNYAFCACTGFDGSLYIGVNVETIGTDAFLNCYGLSGNVFLHENIKNIGDSAFVGCGTNDYYFKGNAPLVTATDFQDPSFDTYSDTIYYPAGDTTWEIVDGKWNGYNVKKWYPDAFASGYCGGEGDGTNLEWSLTKDGTLTISGEGAMADYGNDYVDSVWTTTAPWGEYSDSLKTLVIEDGVTTIGDYAFYRCRSFTGELVIPDSVTAIGHEAFRGCSGFTGDIVIPEGVKKIGRWAFGWDKFTSVSLPSTLTEIDPEAFYYCKNLEKDEVSENNAVYSDVDWLLCSKDETKLIAFPEKKADSYKLPESITEIGTYSFKGIENNIILGENVKTIKTSAFALFDGTIIVNGTVDTIEGEAFCRWGGNYNEITVVFMNGEPVNVAENAFVPDEYCTINLYYLSGTEDKWTFDENGLWNGFEIAEIAPENVIIASGYCGGEGDGTNLEWVIDGAGTLTISGKGAMADYELDAISRPRKTSAPWYGYRETIESIDIEEGVTHIGEHAFLYCKNVSGELVIPEGVKTIGTYAFAGVPFSGNLKLPDSLTDIGSYSFQGTGFEGELVISENVENIYMYAFSLCNFTSAEIPASVKFIEGGALAGVQQNINVSEENENYCSVEGVLFTKDNTELVSFPGGRTGMYTIPSQIVTVGDRAFSGCKLSEIILNGNIKNVEILAFEGINGKIFVNSVLEKVEKWSFYPNVDETTNVYFMAGEPEGVEEDAFIDDEGTLNLYYLSGTEDKWTFDENGLWNGYTVHEWVNEKDAYLTISSATVAVGGTKKVAVDLSEGSNAAMMQFSLKYDPSVLEIVSCNAGELVNGATINSAGAGIVKFAWESLSAVTEAGTVLEIEFKVKDGVSPQKTVVEIDKTQTFVFKRSDESNIVVGTEKGIIDVVNVIYGDISGDGEVNVLDAYKARLIAAKLETPTDMQMLAGDVDGDGKITAVDANYIRKFAVDIITEFPVEQ